MGEDEDVDSSENSKSKELTKDVQPEEGYDIVKATQYGIFERCRELIENGFDVNQRDAENITLLHWAAINCRKDIVKLYIDAGAIVDAIGGELHSSPLHWATRQGHLSMVVYLMKEGADPTLRDGEGCSSIHLAAQFGYTSIVAYLLAKGISPDLQDKNGMTPLMWSCARVHSPDPTRLLLTFGAQTSLQERLHQNTALHWAIQAKNSTALSLLVKRNACLDIPNSDGETPLSLLKKISTSKLLDWVGKKTMDYVLDKAEPKNLGWFQEIKNDKNVKFWGTTLIPFIVLYLFGEILAANIGILVKLGLITVAFVVFRGMGRLVCDDRFMSIFPINVYLATKFWMYVTWFRHIAPVIPMTDSVIMVLMSSVLWYNFVRAWRGDPGIITVSKEERYQTIIDLAEEDGFDPKYFCTTCLVRKPLRSKHCSVCDRCVAKFDHHCPWLSNCVGWKNHKYFIGYLFGLVLMCSIYFMGSIKFWKMSCGIGERGGNVFKVVTCNPWVTFMTTQALIHGVWVAALLSCQLYQILWVGVTTNERLNYSRYAYFNSYGGGHGEKGSECNRKPRKHVFNRTVFHNFIDFFELKWFRSYRRIDWMRAFAPITSHADDSHTHGDGDLSSLLRDDRNNYQYV